jgi:hypothetical protein
MDLQTRLLWVVEGADLRPGSDQINRELTIRAQFGQDLSGVVHVSHKSRR